MRKKIVAGNWKMNENLQEGVALAKEINEALVADKPNCGVVICTPFIHLASVAQVIDQNVVALGAENCADKEKGAYTGEVSAAMVKSTGAQYVILGHSERRQYYGETAEILKEKVQLALANGLKVIFCCGETLEEREANKQNEVVKAELDGSVFNLTAEEWKNIVLAYEPIWAIGTGKTATSDQAEEMLAYIRSIVADKYGKEVADDTTILYGGSCKASNAPELFAKPNIDGGLIGGASLKAADFKGRFSVLKCEKGTIIIDYAHTPDGMKNLLSTARTITKSRLITVFGCGGERDKSKRAQMGKIASEYSDYIVLTSDNPRGEDPLDIIKQIEWGVSVKDVKCIVDRTEAVRFALAEMEEGDTLVIAGKGNESYLEVKGRKIPYSDFDVVARYAR